MSPANETGTGLELRGMSKRFGALAALSDIELTVQPGERRAVLGSNGAGKTGKALLQSLWLFPSRQRSHIIRFRIFRIRGFPSVFVGMIPRPPNPIVSSKTITFLML